MAATMRRSRNYKEKSSGFTFGHFALPIAAVIALGLLFVGIKLFFLTPPHRAGITVTREDLAASHNEITPVIQEPDFALSETGGIDGAFAKAEPEKLETAEVAIVLASPLTQTGKPSMSSSSSSKAVKAETRRASAPAAQKTPAATQAARAGTKSKWGVQIGAFVNEGSASILVSEVTKQGYLASVSKVDSSGKTFHRVRVGAGNSRDDANRLASELEQRGYPVSVVPML